MLRALGDEATRRLLVNQRLWVYRLYPALSKIWKAQYFFTLKKLLDSNLFKKVLALEDIFTAKANAFRLSKNTCTEKCFRIENMTSTF
jgi:hypothetical protein